MGCAGAAVEDYERWGGRGEGAVDLVPGFAGGGEAGNRVFGGAGFGWDEHFGWCGWMDLLRVWWEMRMGRVAELKTWEYIHIYIMPLYIHMLVLVILHIICRRDFWREN